MATQASELQKIFFRPQAGPQTHFLASPADIVIYGGAAGGGKTYGLLLDAGRWVTKNEYHGIIFRRQSTDLHKPGALIDESNKMYPAFHGEFKRKYNKWVFNKNVDIQFCGLQYESDSLTFQGAQFDFLGFDELTHFTESQFWYLIGRLRSTSGNVRPYCRATCNPEPGWVLNLIDWWIQEDGFPDLKRSGIVRWFIKLDDNIHWFDSKETAYERLREWRLPDNIRPKSLTFIPANIEDNKILLRNNPDYIGSLYAQGEIQKQRLLYGNWRIKAKGKVFRLDDFKSFHILPPAFDLTCLFVDSAQETKTANDYTVLSHYGRVGEKLYLIKQYRGKWEINEQFTMLTSFIVNDAPDYVFVEQKANGSALIQMIRRHFKENKGVRIYAIQRHKDKYTRAQDALVYIQSGQVYICPEFDYYNDFISEVTEFSPETLGKVHDDQVDNLCDAVEKMLRNPIKPIVKPVQEEPKNPKNPLLGAMYDNQQSTRRPKISSC